MAELDVEKKNNNDWWKWLLGVVALLIIVWIVIEALDKDDADEMEQPINESPTSTLKEKNQENVFKYNRV